MQINSSTAPVQAATKTAIWTVIGAAWKGVDKKSRELLTLIVGNQKAGVNNITLNAGDRVFLRPNNKRTGINPSTQKAYQDPDYQVCVSPA